MILLSLDWIRFDFRDPNMGWIDGFKASGVFAKVALFLLIFDAFFNWIAFTSTSWGIMADSIANDDTHLGIWRQCQKLTTTCYELDGYANIWWGCFQGVCLLGFVGTNVALLLMLLFMFWDGCKRNKEIGQAAAWTCIVSSVFWLIAVIMFGAKFEDDTDVSGTGANDDKNVGYSHTMAIFTLLVEAIAGVLLLIEALQSPVLGVAETNTKV